MINENNLNIQLNKIKNESEMKQIICQLEKADHASYVYKHHKKAIFCLVISHFLDLSFSLTFHAINIYNIIKWVSFILKTTLFFKGKHREQNSSYTQKKPCKLSSQRISFVKVLHCLPSQSLSYSLTSFSLSMIFFKKVSCYFQLIRF